MKTISVKKIHSIPFFTTFSKLFFFQNIYFNLKLSNVSEILILYKGFLKNTVMELEGSLKITVWTVTHPSDLWWTKSNNKHATEPNLNIKNRVLPNKRFHFIKLLCAILAVNLNVLQRYKLSAHKVKSSTSWRVTKTTLSLRNKLWLILVITHCSGLHIRGSSHELPSHCAYEYLQWDDHLHLKS